LPTSRRKVWKLPLGDIFASREFMCFIQKHDVNMMKDDETWWKMMRDYERW
jgi:hypothetical protein